MKSLVFFVTVGLSIYPLLSSEIILFSNSTPIIRCECREASKTYSETHIYKSAALLGHWSSQIDSYWSLDDDGVPVIRIPIFFEVEGLTAVSHFLSLEKGNGYRQKKFSYSCVTWEDEEGLHETHHWMPRYDDESMDCSNHVFEGNNP
ncbi:MAG: hypothetical protein ACI4SG_03460 [Oligosphaeraceae bacterium]